MKPATTRITISLPLEMAAQLEAVADATDRSASASAIVRRALRAELSEEIISARGLSCRSASVPEAARGVSSEPFLPEPAGRNLSLTPDGVRESGPAGNLSTQDNNSMDDDNPAATRPGAAPGAMPPRYGDHHAEAAARAATLAEQRRVDDQLRRADTAARIARDVAGIGKGEIPR